MKRVKFIYRIVSIFLFIYLILCCNLIVFANDEDIQNKKTTEYNTPTINSYLHDEGYDLLLGDVDNNNVINITDCSLLQKYLLKALVPEDLEFLLRCDTDKNGYVNIKDATLIQMYIAKSITSFEEFTYTQPEIQQNTVLKETDEWGKVYRP